MMFLSKGILKLRKIYWIFWNFSYYHETQLNFNKIFRYFRISHRIGRKWNFSFLITFFTITTKKFLVLIILFINKQKNPGLSINSYGQMTTRKFVDLFGIKDFVSQHLWRISYILTGQLNFWCLQKPFLLIKPERLVKNDWLTQNDSKRRDFMIIWKVIFYI